MGEDSDKVAKIVIYDSKKRVLLLKRSKYHKKYAGEMDLPGGHIKKGEKITVGLKREVKEEPGLSVSGLKFFKRDNNKLFYYAKYKKQPISLSDEHVDYGFYSVKDLNPNNKFEKIALEIMETIKNA